MTANKTPEVYDIAVAANRASEADGTVQSVKAEAMKAIPAARCIGIGRSGAREKAQAWNPAKSHMRQIRTELLIEIGSDLVRVLEDSFENELSISRKRQRMVIVLCLFYKLCICKQIG